jgi:hypothetical protein
MVMIIMLMVMTRRSRGKEQSRRYKVKEKFTLEQAMKAHWGVEV